MLSNRHRDKIPRLDSHYNIYNFFKTFIYLKRLWNLNRTLHFVKRVHFYPKSSNYLLTFCSWNIRSLVYESPVPEHTGNCSTMLENTSPIIAMLSYTHISIIPSATHIHIDKWYCSQLRSILKSYSQLFGFRQRNILFASNPLDAH